MSCDSRLLPQGPGKQLLAGDEEGRAESADRTKWTWLPADRRYLWICQHFSIKIRRVTEVWGGIGQKQQTQTQPSISCLPGVTSGGETFVTHHCKQPLHKDADDGQFSQASAFFFQRSPAPRPLHGKMAQSRQDLHVPTHYPSRAGTWRDGWCFPVQQLHRESSSGMVVLLLLGIWGVSTRAGGNVCQFLHGLV